MTPTIPDLDKLDYYACMKLREQIDDRLDNIRDEFVTKAAALGLELRPTTGKRRKKPRTRDHGPAVSNGAATAS